MALGLGQMLGMGLLSQFMGGFGNNEKKKQLGGQQMRAGAGGQQGVMDIAKLQAQQQQQGQVANNQQGFMGGLSGISNSMFRGMSPEQVARLGMGFNAMTLNPNAGLQASFQSTIDNARKKTNRNATVEALIKMGKPNLANLVQTGAMPVATAMQLAFKETTGDSKGTIAWMETFRGKGTAEQDSKIDSYRALIATAAGDPVAIRDYVDKFSNDFGVGIKNLKDNVSKLQIQQEDGMVGGIEMKEGQKYTIVTDEYGDQTVKIIEGAFGETERMKFDRELEQSLHEQDVKLGEKRADEAYLEAASAIQSVQKYLQVQRTLKNPDGTYNEKAITGWAADMMYDFTAEQSMIGSVAKLMGIDVINMATFGSLSEREMAMAMATNLNTKLPPKELYKQITMMVESRQKLAQELLARTKLYADLGYSQKAFREYRVKENAGHLATRYNKMSKEVKAEIRANQYQAYVAKANEEEIQPMEYDTWNSSPNTMTAYDAWSYINFNDRAKVISQMKGMTGKKYLELMGGTEFALEWWNNNVGGM